VVQENKLQVKDLRDQIRENIASRVGDIKQIFAKRANIRQATISAKGSDSLTITKDGKTFTVKFDAKTKLRRRFFGDTNISEIIVGHIVDVVGKWTDNTQTAIQAQLVRDISIQKRFGVFIGIVTAISGNDITINTVNRGTQKATVNSSTKLVNRKQESISLSDIQVGHRIRLKGTWDNLNNTITDVTNLKDFTIPVIANLTPKPTRIPDATRMPHPTRTPVPSRTATMTPTPSV
jgi:hypothetical protein